MVQAEWTSSLIDSHSCRCSTFDRYPGIPCDSRWHWCCGTAGVRRVFSPRELRPDRILTSFPHGHHLDSDIPNLPRQISGLRELGIPSLLSSVPALHITPAEDLAYWHVYCQWSGATTGGDFLTVTFLLGEISIPVMSLSYYGTVMQTYPIFLPRLQHGKLTALAY